MLKSLLEVEVPTWLSNLRVTLKSYFKLKIVLEVGSCENPPGLEKHMLHQSFGIATGNRFQNRKDGQSLAHKGGAELRFSERILHEKKLCQEYSTLQVIFGDICI